MITISLVDLFDCEYDLHQDGGERTLGFQIRTFNGPSSIGLSNTGIGHCHFSIMRKNFRMIVDDVALGYS